MHKHFARRWCVWGGSQQNSRPKPSADRSLGPSLGTRPAAASAGGSCTSLAARNRARAATCWHGAAVRGAARGEARSSGSGQAKGGGRMVLRGPGSDRGGTVTARPPSLPPSSPPLSHLPHPPTTTTTTTITTTTTTTTFFLSGWACRCSRLRQSHAARRCLAAAAVRAPLLPPRCPAADASAPY